MMMMILFLLAGLLIVGTLEYKLADDATEGWGVIQWPVLLVNRM